MSVIDGEVHLIQIVKVCQLLMVSSLDTTLMLKFVNYWWWGSLDTTLLLKFVNWQFTWLTLMLKLYQVRFTWYNFNVKVCQLTNFNIKVISS